MKRVILFTIVLISLFSCRGEKGSVEMLEYYYFSGKYFSQSDSAVFTDCATNVSYEVSKTKLSQRIKRSYLMLTSTPEQAIFVEFRGKIIKDSISSSNMVVVDSLIGFNVNSRCAENDLIVGVYESTTEGGERSVLRLKPDYTYTQDTFIEENKEVNVSGRWFKSAKLELTLNSTSIEKVNLSFEIIPAQQSFVENSGDKPLVYTKVYL